MNKQLKNSGAAKLSTKGAGDTNQGSPEWQKEVLRRLELDSPAYKEVKKAIANKTIRFGIAGVTKKKIGDIDKGSLLITEVTVPNKAKTGTVTAASEFTGF
ncbi:hypothetical protein [Algibacillus agarilyticus]|uniref:hypothetical protein n=1 Tax=Algibacillus agarilyticus TaxID=2234133 RepID=UPI000DCF8CA7|nr:hypothetical protein [Algibacillus agarilyticus]